MVSALMVAAVLAPRTIDWSGFTWEVKASVGKVGPGPNVFSDAPESVFVDDKGRLHLKVRKSETGWTSSEVYLDKSLGYGTYTFEVDTPAGAVDDNVVLGLFTYGEKEEFAHREIDFEIARWGDAKTDNYQYVVQPYETKENIHRYELPPNDPWSTHTFVWKKGEVAFSTRTSSLKRSWTRKGDAIFPPGDETVHINLWQFQGKDPVKGKEVEVVVKRFSFRKP